MNTNNVEPVTTATLTAANGTRWTLGAAMELDPDTGNYDVYYRYATDGAVTLDLAPDGDGLATLARCLGLTDDEFSDVAREALTAAKDEGAYAAALRVEGVGCPYCTAGRECAGCENDRNAAQELSDLA